jgi:hypothetical protein
MEAMRISKMVTPSYTLTSKKTITTIQVLRRGGDSCCRTAAYLIEGYFGLWLKETTLDGFLISASRGSSVQATYTPSIVDDHTLHPRIRKMRV